MKIKLPTLRGMIETGLKNNVAASRFSVSPDEAKRIRAAGAAGGHNAGLVVVLQLLRDRQARKGN
jgi:hypothetical protein